VQKVSLFDALCATPFEVETLDHRMVPISIDEVINPKYKKAVAEEGMPIFKSDPLASLKKEREKGTLWILFDIEFPKYLGEEKKLKLKSLLA
jgi:DnaJ homolog subfamily B member 4